MSLALQYQVQKLTFLLLQKDAEIEDYRENGATLSRGDEGCQGPRERSEQGASFLPSTGLVCSAPSGY